jgi:hypothetical protein
LRCHTRERSVAYLNKISFSLFYPLRDERVSPRKFLGSGLGHEHVIENTDLYIMIRHLLDRQYFAVPSFFRGELAYAITRHLPTPPNTQLVYSFDPLGAGSSDARKREYHRNEPH